MVRVPCAPTSRISNLADHTRSKFASAKPLDNIWDNNLQIWGAVKGPFRLEARSVRDHGHYSPLRVREDGVGSVRQEIGSLLAPVERGIAFRSS
jgi:hypothetical protein